MKLSELLQEHPEYMEFTLGELIDEVLQSNEALEESMSELMESTKRSKLNIEVAILSPQYHTREELASTMKHYLPAIHKGISRRFDKITVYYVPAGSTTYTVDTYEDWLTMKGLNILAAYDNLDPIYYVIRAFQEGDSSTERIIAYDSNRTQIPINISYKEWQSLGWDYELSKFHKKSSTH